MKIFFSYLLVSIILLLSVIVILPHAFASVENFDTDKSLYHKNDKLTISGNVKYDSKIPFVTIQIFTPGKSNFADFNTIAVNSDGSFSTIFNVGGPTWSSDGTYPIRITYDGNLEKTIEYQEAKPETKTEPKTETKTEPKTETKTETKPEVKIETKEVKTETKPEVKTETKEVKTETKPEVKTAAEPTTLTKFLSTFEISKYTVPNFPSLDKSPQYYIDRYNTEPAYQSWFDSQFPLYSIEDVVGYKTTNLDGFPSHDKSPQYYIDRYNTEPAYKSWFDSQFPNDSIYNILGFMDQSIPDWTSDVIYWWLHDEVSEDEFIQFIEYIIK